MITKYIPNDHKICIPNDHKICIPNDHKRFWIAVKYTSSFHSRALQYKIGIFGMKIYHLATLRTCSATEVCLVGTGIRDGLSRRVFRPILGPIHPSKLAYHWKQTVAKSWHRISMKVRVDENFPSKLLRKFFLNLFQTRLAIYASIFY
jgi:hypothetical protein